MKNILYSFPMSLKINLIVPEEIYFTKVTPLLILNQQFGFFFVSLL